MMIRSTHITHQVNPYTQREMKITNVIPVPIEFFINIVQIRVQKTKQCKIYCKTSILIGWLIICLLGCAVSGGAWNQRKQGPTNRLYGNLMVILWYSKEIYSIYIVVIITKGQGWPWPMLASTKLRPCARWLWVWLVTCIWLNQAHLAWP
jgi:hypothetical protein